MKSIIIRVALIAVIITVFAVTTVQIPTVYSLEFTNENKLYAFLSDVVGLDLTKYSSSSFNISSGVEIPSDITESLPDSLSSLKFAPANRLGDTVELEVLSPKFEYEESQIAIMGIFYNGHMAHLSINSYSQDDYIYLESPPTDILSQATSILQRYQTFASQNYAKDTSYIVPMQNILSNVDDFSPKKITEGNVDFQVSKDGNNTRIQWIYTEGDVSMPRKRVYMKFSNNAFVSFWDTWGLYNVSGLSEVTSEEALQIAMEAAQNCQLHIFNEVQNKSQTVNVPDLLNASYDVNMYMAPYRIVETDFVFTSKIARDPLTLYPVWQLHFYFNETIAGLQGVQVGVWGDTGEIIYCSGFGYFGASGTTNEPLEEQNQANTLNPLILAIVAGLVAVPMISISVIALRHKKRHK